jgi:hypothetical protein
VTADCDDNCVLVANADQEDGNGDGFGDACSLLDGNDEPTIPDRDVDGKADVLDNCLWIANPDQTDAEPDGIGDACERIASIDLGGTGEIDLGPVDVTLGDGPQKFLSLDFDDRVAVVDCDAAFTSCRLDPSMVLLTVP